MNRYWLVAACVPIALSLLVAPPLIFVEKITFTDSSAAMLICMLPAVASLAWASRAGVAPENQLTAILGGTGLRMMVVMGGGFLYQAAVEDRSTHPFWILLGFDYLVTLALETYFLLRRFKVFS